MIGINDLAYLTVQSLPLLFREWLNTDPPRNVHFVTPVEEHFDESCSRDLPFVSPKLIDPKLFGVRKASKDRSNIECVGLTHALASLLNLLQSLFVGF